MKFKKIIIFNIVSYLKVPGGAQQSIEECIKYLSKKNKIIFVTLTTKSRDEIDYSAFNFYGNKILRYEILVSWRNILKLPFLFSKVVLKLIKFKPQILWSHHPVPFIFFKPFFPFTKSILTFHGPFYREMRLNNEHFLKKILYYLFFIIATQYSNIHYDTKYTRTEVQKELKFLIGSKRNIFTGPALIYPTLYTKKFEKYLDSGELNLKGNFILIPRRLEPRTGVYQFLEMINKPITKQYIKLKFIITGSGKDFNLISKFQSNNFEFDITGFIPYSELVEKLFKCKYLLIPSFDAEGYCLPARIAYILGKPIVSTGIGGLLDAYPDKRGFFVYSNLDSFFNAHQKALKFKLNRDDLIKRHLNAQKQFKNNLKKIIK